jgi:hypothetical protein
MALSVPSFSCTSVIISGKVRFDGKPVMLKHRDSDYMDNRVQWFKGPKYSFTGLVNSSSDGSEVWTGTNSAGFCIMNTATYDLKDDDIPQSEMDKEGFLMHDVLGKIATVEEFQNYLDTLRKPWHVEANFGVIDAFGGAAYFEVNNHEYTRFNVDDEPGGYMVVTNFTRTGRKEDRVGVERWEKACSIMKNIDVYHADHKVLFNEISRSYLPILRDITTCAIVLEGVPSGTDPSKTVMWTICGSPSNCIYIPLMEKEFDNIPKFMKSTAYSKNAGICDVALSYKEKYGIDPGCADECMKIEKYIDKNFSADMSSGRYERVMNKAYKRFRKISSRKVSL